MALVIAVWDGFGCGQQKELDDVEVELLADAVAGNPDANLAQYRANRDGGSSPNR